MRELSAHLKRVALAPAIMFENLRTSDEALAARMIHERKAMLEGGRAAAKGGYSPFTDVVSEWLMGHGYVLEPGSSGFRKVAREFAKATQQKLEIQRRRNEGEFVESPSAPKMEVDRPASVVPSGAGTPSLGQVVAHFLNTFRLRLGLVK